MAEHVVVAMHCEAIHDIAHCLLSSQIVGVDYIEHIFKVPFNASIIALVDKVLVHLVFHVKLLSSSILERERERESISFVDSCKECGSLSTTTASPG